MSSVGSLPDYEDLRGAQLPLAKQYIQEWLRHPEQPITKEKVKHLKEQIHQAKHSTLPADIPFDKATLRREVKDLVREWKGLKQRQKQQRKQLLREKKHRRRHEKREQRQIKREMKQAAREHRHEQRHNPFGVPHMQHMPHMPGFPGVPGVPGAPGAPGVPGVPNMPGMSQSGPFPTPPPFPFFNHPPPLWDAGNSQGPIPRGPGAWPTDDKTDYNDTATNHATSQAKYKAAKVLELQLEHKEAELMQLHEQLAREHDAGQGSNSGSGNKPTDGKNKASEAETAAWEAEKEMEALAVAYERLLTEADEEFAKELGEEEKRRVRG